MASIAEIRQKYPQYNDMSDQALADALYAKHYSDMPRADFDAKVGLTKAAPADPAAVKAAVDRASLRHFPLIGGALATGADAIDALNAGGGVTKSDEAAGWERNTLLPRAVNPQTGEQRLAVPGVIQGVFDSVKSGLTLPGDVASGQVDPMSDEGIRRGLDFTTMTMLPTTGGVGQKAATTVLPREVTAAARALPVATKVAPKTVAAAKAASKSAYRQVENSGAIVGQDALNLLRHDFNEFATSEGLRYPSGELVDDFPKIRTALKSMEQFTSAPLNMKSAMTFQRQLRRAAKSNDPEEARLGAMMLDQFEEFMSALPPKAFQTVGDGTDVGAKWMFAKQEWATFRKGQMIEDAIAAAYRKAKKFSGSGFENALRNQFDQLAGNAKKMRFFTAEERALIEAVQKGTPLANILRDVGKFAPTGVVGTTLSGLAGYGLFGLPGAAAMLGGGGLARGLATKETKKAADAVLQRVLGGKNPGLVGGPSKRAPQPLSPAQLKFYELLHRSPGPLAPQDAGPGPFMDSTGRVDPRLLIGTTIGA